MRNLDVFTPLFAYPDDSYPAHAERCAVETECPSARAFADLVSSLSTTELQERFIQAFDLNPASTLEIGWHLFGEQYERGEFLVDVRGRLRQAGVPETHELPDHLLHVLPLVARLDEDEARAFVDKFLLPSVTKIVEGLPAESVYRPLVRGLLECTQ
jgi:nitrate reductase delta subunit